MKLPKTDYNDRTHKNHANNLFMTYGQCFFLTISSYKQFKSLVLES